MALCVGYRSHGVRCSKVALGDDNYCLGHQYQSDPNKICKGKTKKNQPCFGRVKIGKNYCREAHNPSFVQHVKPSDLRPEWDYSNADRREEWNRKRVAVAEDQNWIEAFTGNPIVKTYASSKAQPGHDIVKVHGSHHLDHVNELQLIAETANRAVVKRFNDGQAEQQKEDLVSLLKDVANRLKYLQVTSAPVNTLKGDACTKLIECWREGNETTTFTDCLRNASSTKFRGQELREEASSIRKTMLKVTKQQIHRVEDEAEDNELTKTYIAESMEIRARLQK